MQSYDFFGSISSLLHDGQLGVNVFFVISGFLITYLLLQEEEQNGHFSVMNFYKRRALRIFPAYYFLLLIFVLLDFLDFIWLSDPSYLTSFTFNKYFNYKRDWLTGHLWTLSVEIHFYILWPFILRKFKTQRKQIAWSLFLIVPLVRLLLFFYPVDWILEYSFFTRMDAIVTGCLCAFYKDKLTSLFGAHGKYVFYVAVLSLFLLSYLDSLLSVYNFGLLYQFIGTTSGTIANIMIGLILMFSIANETSVWYKFLTWRWVQFLGTLSFSIYLWQQLFISKAGYWINVFPLNILLIFLAAMLSYYFVEKPFLRLKFKFKGDM